MTQQTSAQEIAQMGQIVEMIVDRICFEITDPNADREARMAQVQQVAATVAEGAFNAVFGSTMSSFMAVGKAQTVKRIDGANKVACMFMAVAVEIVQRMTPAQIVEAANRVATMGQAQQ